MSDPAQPSQPAQPAQPARQTEASIVGLRAGKLDAKLLFLIWSLPGLMHALQGWVFETATASPVQIFLFYVPWWWPWIAATPVVLGLADKLPISDDLETLPAADETDRPPVVEPGPKTWCLHALLAIFMAAVHMWLLLMWGSLFPVFSRPEVDTESFLRSLLQPVFMVSLSSYLLILCAHYIAGLAARLHQRNLQENRLLGRLAEAEIRSLRMQLQPEALAESFEAISNQVQNGEFDTAESAINRLARDLRETLRHGDNLPEVWSNPDFERRSRRRHRP